jgi:hypothetical protein
MLDIKNLEQVRYQQMQDLVVEFRKHQVSRFPIEVIPSDSGHSIGFIDSRFPTDRWNANNMLAMLHIKDDGENPTLTIESRLIENDKFAQYNDEYHTRSTKDMKKMLKFMKDYIKPWTAHEVASKTKRSMEDKLSSWQAQPSRTLREFNYKLNDFELVRSFMKLKDMGVAPVDDTMKAMYESVIPNYLDHQARQEKKFTDYCHAFINPDESVFISKVGIDAGRTVAKLFNSADEIPPEVQQNIAMLRMVDSGTFMPNVGMKATDREFWVEGYPEDLNA